MRSTKRLNSRSNRATFRVMTTSTTNSSTLHAVARRESIRRMPSLRRWVNAITLPINRTISSTIPIITCNDRTLRDRRRFRRPRPSICPRATALARGSFRSGRRNFSGFSGGRVGDTIALAATLALKCYFPFDPIRRVNRKCSVFQTDISFAGGKVRRPVTAVYQSVSSGQGPEESRLNWAA